MPDDVIVNKAEIVEKCLKRIHEICGGSAATALADELRYEAILFNLEKACQASIDLAMRWVRIRSLGVPKESREAFTLLETAKLIDPGLASVLRKMVGFRNVAVHDYQALDRGIVLKTIESDFRELRDFLKLAIISS